MPATQFKKSSPSPDTASAVNGLPLFNIDLAPDGQSDTAPETRLANATSGREIFTSLSTADDAASQRRANIQAMFDGVPPYKQSLLNATGQGSRCNLNFGEAERLHNTALAGFVDLEASVQNLISVSTTLGGPAEKLHNDKVVAAEITRALRSWPEFYPNYLRLCSEFIDHGVGVAYFPTADDWRFRVSGLGDFFIPRQTSASEDAVEVAAARREYRVDELYNFISKPESAERAGWDVALVRRAILSATPKNSAAGQEATWEALEREIKNNDLNYGIRSSTVTTIHMWVKEFGGQVSHFIFPESEPGTGQAVGGVAPPSTKDGFMFRKINRFERSEQAFVFFTYGVGTNGTFHSVRGLGQRIFNHIQTSNRLRCQAVDAGMLASSILLQPQGQRALDELSLQYYGPYAVLSPNVNLVEKGVPNLQQSVLPVLNDMGQQLNDAVGFYSNHQGAQGSPYRTTVQVQAELEAATKLSSSSLHLFYASFTRMLREVVRRLVSPENRQDEAVKEILRRLAEQQVPDEVFFSIDTAKTHANKAIGSGNPSQRAAALQSVERRLPMLDPGGKQNAIFDLVAADVGYETAGRYASPSDELREAPEQKTAILENSMLRRAEPVQVLGIENHAIHTQQHVPLLQELLEGLEQGTLEPVENLPVLQTVQGHIVEHVQMLAGDPTNQALVGQMSDFLNQASQIITNTERQIVAKQRQELQDGGGEAPEGEQQAGPSVEEIKLQEAQAKRDLELRKLELAREKFKVESQIALSKEERERQKTDIELSLQLAEKGLPQNQGSA